MWKDLHYNASCKFKIRYVGYVFFFNFFFSRVLIRQHKAQMKRKSKEIQEALVQYDLSQLISDETALFYF